MGGGRWWKDRSYLMPFYVIWVRFDKVSLFDTSLTKIGPVVNSIDQVGGV